MRMTDSCDLCDVVDKLLTAMISEALKEFSTVMLEEWTIMKRLIVREMNIFVHRNDKLIFSFLKCQWSEIIETARRSAERMETERAYVFF